MVVAPCLLFACSGPAFVERVVLVNDTDYSVSVDVRGETDGWLSLATLPSHRSRAIGQVIDQGMTWTFRFSHGYHDPFEVELSRRPLADADWRVEVPAELEADLRAEGVPPSP
ncbi:MAG TPA: hypothetical protein VHN37_09730 [Actinomycetota bacterium]|nr:hypothetical protein [Actinomycetota bacterium]